MYLPINQWPVSQDIGRNDVPDAELIRIKTAASVNVRDPIIDYEKYKGRSYDFARNVTALLIRIKRQRSFKNSELTIKDLNDAESFMLRISMKLTKEMLDRGKLNSLRPEMCPDGIIRLGGRALEGMRKFYENENYPILSHNDPLAYLWVKKVHREDHSGITRTVEKEILDCYGAKVGHEN